MMKLALLNNIGSYGVILEPDKIISGSHLAIECEHNGVITIGAASHRVKVGMTYIRESEIPQGISKVIFVAEGGACYDCGHIIRSGRSVSTSNQNDELMVALAKAYDDQAKEIKSLKEEFKCFKDKFGISII